MKDKIDLPDEGDRAMERVMNLYEEVKFKSRIIELLKLVDLRLNNCEVFVMTKEKAHEAMQPLYDDVRRQVSDMIKELTNKK